MLQVLSRQHFVPVVYIDLIDYLQPKKFPVATDFILSAYWSLSKKKKKINVILPILVIMMKLSN